MCRASGGIDDQHVAAGNHGLAARFLNQTFYSKLGRGVRFGDLAFVDMALYRLRDNLQLLARRRTVNVDRNQQRTVSAILQPVRQLAGGGGLTGTLQSGHQDDGRRLRRKLHARRIFAEDLDQFVAQNLDDLLSGRKRGHHFLTDGLGADLVDQLLDDFEVDVGLEQRQPDFAERLVNVLLGEGCLVRGGT